MDGTEVIDPQSTGEATAKTDAGGSATETVASEGTQGQEANAGGPQGQSEGGKDNGTASNRPRFISKQQQLYELKQKLRERDAQIDQFNERMARIEQMFQRTGQEQKPSRTFYEAPEDTLRELLKESLEPFRENLLGEIRQTQEERDRQMSLRQETSEAAKFIRSQKGITEDDIQEIRDYLVSDKTLQSLADQPMEQARYALYLFNQNKGVSDKTNLKNRAASVQGAPPQGSGPKQWTEAEIYAELRKIGDVQKGLTPEQTAKRDALKAEIRKAYAEGRVKK